MVWICKWVGKRKALPFITSKQSAQLKKSTQLFKRKRCIFFCKKSAKVAETVASKLNAVLFQEATLMGKVKRDLWMGTYKIEGEDKLISRLFLWAGDAYMSFKFSLPGY